MEQDNSLPSLSIFSALLAFCSFYAPFEQIIDFTKSVNRGAGKKAAESFC